jgi:hypothetical protein
MPSTAPPVLLVDAGYILTAAIGSTIPSMTVSGSKFTDAWPVAWASPGSTEDGSEFDYNIKVEAIYAAEFYDPLTYRTTERTGSFAYAMQNWTLTNLKQSMNGGTLTVVSGTGATQLNTFTPPTPGNEVRQMVGWESLDNTLRMIGYQTISSGTIKSANKKAPNNASIPVVLNFEVPSSGNPFQWWSAGTSRA